MEREIAKRRIVALIVAFTTLFVVLFSMVYLSDHVTHHCHEEKCQVCETLHRCAYNLKTLISAVAVSFKAVFAACVAVILIKCENELFSHMSLISQKVRMND